MAPNISLLLRSRSLSSKRSPIDVGIVPSRFEFLTRSVVIRLASVSRLSWLVGDDCSTIVHPMYTSESLSDAQEQGSSVPALHHEDSAVSLGTKALYTSLKAPQSLESPVHGHSTGNTVDVVLCPTLDVVLWLAVDPEPGTSLDVVLGLAFDVVLGPTVNVVLENALDVMLEPAVELGPAVDVVLEAASDVVLERTVDVLLGPAFDVVLEPAVELDQAFDVVLGPALDAVLEPADDVVLVPAMDVVLGLATDVVLDCAVDVELVIVDVAVVDGRVKFPLRQLSASGINPVTSLNSQHLPCASSTSAYAMHNGVCLQNSQHSKREHPPSSATQSKIGSMTAPW